MPRSTKREIDELEAGIQEELAKVKDRLAELQNAQKAARQMYDAACQRLGVRNELDVIDVGQARARSLVYGPIMYE